AVYALVRDGKLPANADLPDALALAFQSTLQHSRAIGSDLDLMPESVEILVAAATGPTGDDDEPAPMVMAPDIPMISAGSKSFGGNDPRRVARYRKAFNALIDRG